MWKARRCVGTEPMAIVGISSSRANRSSTRSRCSSCSCSKVVCMDENMPIVWPICSDEITGACEPTEDKAVGVDAAGDLRAVTTAGRRREFPGRVAWAALRCRRVNPDTFLIIGTPRLRSTFSPLTPSRRRCARWRDRVGRIVCGRSVDASVRNRWPP